jgi:hypothetical protein
MGRLVVEAKPEREDGASSVDGRRGSIRSRVGCSARKVGCAKDQ